MYFDDPRVPVPNLSEERRSMFLFYVSRDTVHNLAVDCRSENRASLQICRYPRGFSPGSTGLIEARGRGYRDAHMTDQDRNCA